MRVSVNLSARQFADNEAREVTVAHAEVRARLEVQTVALADRLAAAEQAPQRTASELDAVQAELAADGEGRTGRRTGRACRPPQPG